MKALRIAAVCAAVVAAAALALALRRPVSTQAPPVAPKPAAQPKLPTIGFVVGSAADGRWGPVPCCGIRGGGLYSLPALRDEMKVRLPLTVSAFLGDIGPGPGDLGRMIAHYAWTEIVDDIDFPFAAAGPSDLALGSDFAREVLASSRDNLHPITVKSIETVLAVSPASGAR